MRLAPKYFADSKTMLVRMEQLAVQVRGEVDSQLKAGRNLNAEEKTATRPAPARRFTRNYSKRMSRRGVCKHVPQAGEIRLWEFVVSEMKRLGVSKDAIYTRIAAEAYPGVKVRRVNCKVIFVRVKSLPPAILHQPEPGEVALKEFVQVEAARLGLPFHTIYARFSRGGYPHMAARRVNKRMIFVRPISTEGKQVAA